MGTFTLKKPILLLSKYQHGDIGFVPVGQVHPGLIFESKATSAASRLVMVDSGLFLSMSRLDDVLNDF